MPRSGMQTQEGTRAMKIGALIALTLASHAHAEVLHLLSDNLWVGNRGSATKLRNC